VGAAVGWLPLRDAGRWVQTMSSRRRTVAEWKRISKLNSRLVSREFDVVAAAAQAHVSAEPLVPDALRALVVKRIAAERDGWVHGDTLLAPEITRRLIDHFLRTAPITPPPPLGELTARELEVLKHVARGLSNAKIARRLYISEGTTKTHVARILSKLDLRDRVQAVCSRTSTASSSPDHPTRLRRLDIAGSTTQP
jgi:DNA-binding CsgD family transcriptional regulator